MPSRISNQSRGDKLVGVFEIGEGGHGKQLARDGLLALGGLAAIDIGNPNNCIPLNADGLIDKSYFGDLKVIETGLDGPTTVARGAVAVYALTTFDSYVDYVVSAERGNVELKGKMLYYRAPLAIGTDVITIDTRTFEIQVTGVEIEKPTILTPSADFEGSFNSMTFETSTATILNNPGSEQHETTDWELSTDPNFQVLYRYAYQSSDRTVWVAQGFQEGMDYYLRCRYNGRHGSSAWSDVRRVTKTVPTLIETPAIVYPADQAFVPAGEITFTTSPFTATGYIDIHQSTDWLVSTTSNFSNVVLEVNASSTDLTSLTTAALESMVLYYVKCRYRGEARISDWSQAVSFVKDSQ